MTSLYASEIGIQFSKPNRDVKAFLFVQINRDVARCVTETRAVTLSTKIRMSLICFSRSKSYAIYGVAGYWCGLPSIQTMPVLGKVEDSAGMT
jgi:hypothetical protein